MKICQRNTRRRDSGCFLAELLGGKNHSALSRLRCYLSTQQFPSCSICKSLSSGPLAPPSEACVAQSRPVRNPGPRNKATVAFVSVRVCAGSRRRRQAVFAGSRWPGLLYISEYFNCKAGWSCCHRWGHRTEKGPLGAELLGGRLSGPEVGLMGGQGGVWREGRR